MRWHKSVLVMSFSGSHLLQRPQNKIVCHGHAICNHDIVNVV